ncbi:hypothetical protein B0A49_07624 [Cryomyces minteri]|uniref:PCI domain-containing protein n=1 Tax=Cryomyces minteri TaxID=331657 RepID=A0A4U0WW40_9PEZI|nr:hypothetical protein B0A49_07624 [Cryomyces minteri]
MAESMEGVVTADRQQDTEVDTLKSTVSAEGLSKIELWSRRTANRIRYQELAKANHSVYTIFASDYTALRWFDGFSPFDDDDDLDIAHRQFLLDIISTFGLLEQAVAQFDARFTLRALRFISTIRKRLTPRVLAHVLMVLYTSEEPQFKYFMSYLGENKLGENHGLVSDVVESLREHWGLSERHLGEKNGAAPKIPWSKEVLPEIEVYISIMIQVHLFDTKQYESGAGFSTELVDRIREHNRRTLDSLGAKAYLYFHLFHEQLHPKPPSRQSPVIDLRGKLLGALRSAVLRKDLDTQASVSVLLLRNYISTADITQADLFVAQTQFPPSASNNQVARYLFYLGRIRAIQLNYTAAHEHLTSATRKSPTTTVASGFYQSATKFLIVVELLMGDIPDRALFRQPSLEFALEPYFRLVQKVRIGDLAGFNKTVKEQEEKFRKDGTYTLIVRLRQNVIKTGVRMLSLSYSRISLRDICIRLGVESEESAEYIVAKAIRDGVIEATIDHEKGYMESKQAGDVYATREPAEAFHERIKACLAIHDDCIKAMRFPMNQHRLELKNAQEARERERELAKEIQDGEIDEDDAGEGFEGM